MQHEPTVGVIPTLHVPIQSSNDLKLRSDSSSQQKGAICVCPCACACPIPCYHSSSHLSSSSSPSTSPSLPTATATTAPSPSASSSPACIRVRWAHVGARLGGGRNHTDIADAYATNPCKVIQPRRWALDGGSGSATGNSNAMEVDSKDTPEMTALKKFQAAATAAFLGASPQNSTHAGVIYLSSYGGGICASDRISADLTVDAHATGVVLTQGFSKIYSPLPQSAKSNGASFPHPTQVASQCVSLKIAEDGLLLWIPEATLLHAGARFRAPTTIELSSATASFIWMDWLYAGRVARGEVYAFDHYQTTLHVHVRRPDSQKLHPLLLETMTLEQESNLNGLNSLAKQLLPYKTYVTVYLMGERVAPLAAAIHAHVSTTHLNSATGSAPPVLLSTQPFEYSIPAEGQGGACSVRGAIFRLAAVELEDLHKALHQYLGCVEDLISVEPPWQR